ncbi:MAG: hypothetical protein ABIH53_02150 [archaeon]
MRWNYNQRRRTKILAVIIAVLLLYLNIQFLSENNGIIPTGKAIGNVDMCIDEYMAFTAIDYINVTVDNELIYDLNITDEETYNTVIYGDNTSLFNINTATGLIQFTPRSDQQGNYWINITARNNFCDNNDTSIVFKLNINPSNYAPTLNMPDQVLDEDTLYIYDVSQNVTDPEGDTISYYDDTPLFVIGEESGIIAFTPTQANIGAYTVRIYVLDSKGALGYQDVQFTISNVNDAPVLTAIGSQTAYVGEPWNHTLSATDEDSSEYLTLRSNYTNFLDTTSKIATTSNEASYFLSLSTNWTTNGTYNINMTVNDTSGAEDSEVISFTILYRNNPPNITNHYPTDLTPAAYKYEYQIFNITATDPDGTTPSTEWFIDGAPIGITSINYTHYADTTGTFNITAIVTDGELNDSISWILSVSAAETPATPTPTPGGGPPSAFAMSCQELWVCTDWSACPKNEIQIRDCNDIYKCGTLKNRPKVMQDCIYVEHPSCFDGVKNQDEILPDCGGLCNPCPVCGDGIQNQGETGVDCGGPCSACKHKETPKLLGKYRDRIVTPLELFTYPNESWPFWALLPVMLFVLYRTGSVIIKRRSRKKGAPKIPKPDKTLNEIETLIKVTDVSMKNKDYPTAKASYKKIIDLYNKLPSKAKSQVYDKISKLSK